MLPASGCLGPGQPEWLLKRLGGAAWGEVCGRVTIWAGILGSVPTDLGEFSVSLPGAGAPRATDCSCVLEVMYCEGEWGWLGKPAIAAPMVP